MMDDLYERMKAALDLFGLSFHEMHKVTVTVSGGAVTFSYQGTEITYTDFAENTPDDGED